MESVASLCHPWFTTTNLSYRFPIFETSATALCGTTGMEWHDPHPMVSAQKHLLVFPRQAMLCGASCRFIRLSSSVILKPSSRTRAACCWSAQAAARTQERPSPSENAPCIEAQNNPQPKSSLGTQWTWTSVKTSKITSKIVNVTFHLLKFTNWLWIPTLTISKNQRSFQPHHLSVWVKLGSAEGTVASMLLIFPHSVL